MARSPRALELQAEYITKVAGSHGLGHQLVLTHGLNVVVPSTAAEPNNPLASSTLSWRRRSDSVSTCVCEKAA
jgi:hypothetical protein